MKINGIVLAASSAYNTPMTIEGDLSEFSEEQIRAELRRRASQRKNNRLKQELIAQQPVLERDLGSKGRAAQMIQAAVRELLTLYEDKTSGIFDEEFLSVEHHADFAAIVTHLTKTVTLGNTHPTLGNIHHTFKRTPMLYLPTKPDFTKHIRDGAIPVTLFVPEQGGREQLVATFHAPSKELVYSKFLVGQADDPQRAAVKLRGVASTLDS